MEWVAIRSGGALSSAQVLAACICGVVALMLYCVLHTYSLVGKRKLLPPGSFGLPLLGETLQFVFFSTAPIGTPLPFFSLRRERYGRIFKTHLLGRPTVVSMDPELSKFLYNNDDKLIKFYFPTVLKMILGPIPTLQGASHRALRELANLSISAMAIQKLHVDSVQEHIVAWLETWKHQSFDQVFEAQHECKELLFTYSMKFILGLDRDDPYTKSLMEDFFALSSGYSSVPIYLVGAKLYKVVKARQRILATITELARSRKQGAQKEHTDVLDVLLKRVDKSGEHFGGVHIVEWIFIFVVGSYETTYMLFVNAIKFLCENPHVVDELKRENLAIQSGKTQGEKLTWEDYLEKMPLTRNVVRETLRLANIIPFIMKDALEDISFKGMIIPKGWMIILNFSMGHMDPSHYPEPLRFNPWRWMDSQSDKQANNPSFLTPFGGGHRICPGSSLATFDAAMFIHYLVTSYRWKRIVGNEEEQDEMNCLSFPIIHKGLHLTVEPLS